jgi:hypothetical protein
VYGRHEFVNSLASPFQLDARDRRNQTVFGVAGELGNDTTAYSEYRVPLALGGRETEAAVGIASGWQLATGLRATGSVENLTSRQTQEDATEENSGRESSHALAVATGLEYTALPAIKSSLRLENRTASDSDTWLSTLSSAWKLDEHWVLLSKNIFGRSLSKTSDDADRLEERFQIGVAYRDLDSSQLSRYEFKREVDQALDLNRQAQVVSWHINQMLTDTWDWSGRLAGKVVEENSDDFTSHAVATLLGSRFTRDIGQHWDLSVGGNVEFAQGVRQLAWGVEAGYLLQDNVWLSVGYNFSGFEERDMAGEDYTERGLYLRLRIKFDENLFH